jgi:hypothetical protein
MSGRKISSCSPTSSFISCRLRLVFFRVMVFFLGCSLVTPTSYHDPFFAEPFGHYPNLSDASRSPTPRTGARPPFLGTDPEIIWHESLPLRQLGETSEGQASNSSRFLGTDPDFGCPRIRLAFGDRLRFRSLQLWLRSLRDHRRIGSSFNSVGGLVLVLVLLHVLENADVSPLEQWNKITTR